MTHEVPSDWKLAALEDICEVLDSKRVPLNSEDRRDKKGSIPYWGANGIVDYIDDFIFNEPLLLMAEDGGYFNEARTRPICHRLDGKAWVNNHAHVLRVLAPTLRDWVYYWFVHRDITQHINGSTRSKLNQKDLRRLPICLPPLPEQKKIAEVLSSVDEAIAATKAVIDQTKQVKKGLLQTLLTKGIGHNKFKQTELGGIPESWEVKKLSEIARVIDCKHRTPKYYDEGFPIVRPRDVKEGPLELSNCIKTSEEEYLDLIEPHKPEQGDIVFSRNATFGIGAIVESEQLFAIGQDVCIIHGCTLSGSLLFYIINSPVVQNQLKKLSSGSTFKRINLKDIRNLLLPEVPPQEQGNIVKRLRAIDNFSMAETSKLKQLEIVKSGLMADLLTGRKRVEVPDA